MKRVCKECGMTTLTDSEYHPYAACLMFKACWDGEVVRKNLAAVVEHGYGTKKKQRRY